MAEVLGRVLASDLLSPRGPDAFHRVRVPGAWLERGATIELELPRYLGCAACEGGGCDICHRSGAVTLRGRDEPSDVVEVSLPEGARDQAFVIRIPERGGLAPADSLLPRGHLLLRVEPSGADEAPAFVTLRGPRGGRTRKAIAERAAFGRGSERHAFLAGLLLLAILAAIWLLSQR
jgi:hypothetical protein